MEMGDVGKMATMSDRVLLVRVGMDSEGMTDDREVVSASVVRENAHSECNEKPSFGPITRTALRALPCVAR
jgi:hypothetical protein